MTLTVLGTPGTVEATTPVAVEVRGLVKRYGEIEAVRGIDLSVRRGELFGFLGPNGAGKSTTIKILCTLVHPTAGEARVAGLDVTSDRSAVRRHIGLVFQDPTVDAYLTAEQNLRFHAAVYGMPRRTVPARIDTVLELVGLADRRRTRVGNFSGGMKRRLEVARALLHSPRVLFLDEPTIGLDPESRLTLWSYIDELRRQEDITVFLTTHYMDEAERCDRLAVVNHGRVVALGSPAELKAAVGHDRVVFHTADDRAAAATVAKRFDVEVTQDGAALIAAVAEGESFLPRLFELGVAVRSVRVERPTLDDVFMAHAGRRIADVNKTTPAKGAHR